MKPGFEARGLRSLFLAIPPSSSCAELGCLAVAPASIPQHSVPDQAARIPQRGMDVIIAFVLTDTAQLAAPSYYHRTHG